MTASFLLFATIGFAAAQLETNFVEASSTVPATCSASR